MPGQAKNIFAIGRDRRRGREDQLTEMLAWLAQSIPAVALTLFHAALGDVNADAGEIQVATQQGISVAADAAAAAAAEDGQLDLVVEAPGAIVVVESKLQSGFGRGQIQKYLRWLASTHAATPHKALMTLTQHPAPWSSADRRLAAQVGVEPIERRWAAMHVELSELVTCTQTADPAAAALIGQFLDMLRGDGIEPVRPLSDDELGTAWAQGRTPPGRFHAFFSECKPLIAELIGAQAHPNQWSELDTAPLRPFQTFNWPDGRGRAVVGLSRSRGSAVQAEPSPTPIVWVAVEAHPPPRFGATRLRRLGWQEGGLWDTDKRTVVDRSWASASATLLPRVWQDLQTAASGDTFEAQRERLCRVCAAAVSHLHAPHLVKAEHRGG